MSRQEHVTSCTGRTRNALDLFHIHIFELRQDLVVDYLIDPFEARFKDFIANLLDGKLLAHIGEKLGLLCEMRCKFSKDTMQLMSHESLSLKVIVTPKCAAWAILFLAIAHVLF